MNHAQFTVIDNVAKAAPAPFKGRLHVSLDYENGSIHIITTSHDAPIIDWRIDQAVNYIVSEGDPDKKNYMQPIAEFKTFAELQEFIVNAFINIANDTCECFYFNFGSAHKHSNIFCRVVVPKGQSAKDVAKAKFVGKFGKTGWAFQYTAEEFAKFPSEPWWLGTEQVVDFDDLDP